MVMAPIPELTEEEIRQSLGGFDSNRPRNLSTSQSDMKGSTSKLEQVPTINAASLSPR